MTDFVTGEGSCRFGPASVVEENGRIWAYDNLYIVGTAVLAQANAGKPTITCIAAPCGRSIISLVRVDSRLRVGAAAHVIVLAGKTNAMARHKFLHGVVLPSLEDILLPNSFGR